MLIQEGVPEPASATSFLPLSPDWLRLWRYYDARAPEKLPDPEPWPAADGEPIAFERTAVAGARASGAIAIANIGLVDVDADKRLDVGSLMPPAPALFCFPVIRGPRQPDNVPLFKAPIRHRRGSARYGCPSISSTPSMRGTQAIRRLTQICRFGRPSS